MLYATEVKLPSWIPEIVVTFLTKTVLVESTTWVKREAEENRAAGAGDLYSPLGDAGCYRYDSANNKLVYQVHKNASCIKLDGFRFQDNDVKSGVSARETSINDVWMSLSSLYSAIIRGIDDRYVILGIGTVVGMIAFSLPVMLIQSDNKYP